MLESKRLILRLMEIDDSDVVLKWRNKNEVISECFSDRGITLSEHQNWFDKIKTTNTRIEFIIVLKDEERRIGTIGLSNIDYKNQKAEYGILIGETAEWGKGYAKEASKLILDYAFKELNSMKIYLRVFAQNMAAIRLYNSLGFEQEGLLRKEFYKNGEFKDVINMAIFREGWKNV